MAKWVEPELLLVKQVIAIAMHFNLKLSNMARKKQKRDEDCW